jgi:sterol-4alpha-carboxylate 3-dehydrogenase (decarboxylating)
LLWRNEKKTFVSFLVLNLFYYWFFFSGNTFTSSAAQLLFIFAVALYGVSFVPSKIFGFQVNKIPPWRFEISESAVRDLSSDIVVVWNQGVRSFKSLSSGGDWIKFFKVQFYSLCSPNMKNISLLSFPKTKHKNRLQDHCISSN